MLTVSTNSSNNKKIYYKFCFLLSKTNEFLICDQVISVCHNFRTKLGTSLNVMPHEKNKKNITWEDYTSTNLSTHSLCEKLIFIEPLSWMQNISHSVGGKLFCPKESCKQKVGSFSWTIGRKFCKLKIKCHC